VYDGYTHFPNSSIGSPVTPGPGLQVGSVANRVLYDYTGHPVAQSLYDIQFAQRAKLLPPAGDDDGAIIVDDADSAHVASTGSWTVSTYSPGYLGADYLHDGDTGKGSKTFSFLPAIPAAGDYAVYARWTSGTNRATNVPIDIVKADASVATVSVNQQQDNNAWVLLGTFPLSPTNAEVKIRTDGTNGFVIADGVRVIPQ